MAAACTPDVSSPSPRPTSLSAGGSTLSGGGWIFGECGKGCLATATIDEVGGIEVRVLDSSAASPYVYGGWLTPKGQREAKTYSSIDVAALKEVYGCPDCTDRGGGFLTWVEGSDPVKVTFDYGRPPVQLRDAFQFINRVVRTLMTCGDSSNVVATPPLHACNRYGAWND